MDLPLSQCGMSGLPAGGFDVVIVDVLLGGGGCRGGGCLGHLDDGLLGGRCHRRAVTVLEVGVYAGRVQLCSHLLIQGQSHDFIACWQLARLLPTFSSPFEALWKQKKKRQQLHDPAIQAVRGCWHQRANPRVCGVIERQCVVVSGEL